MKMFRIDMEVAATAYIKAEDFNDAYKKAAEMVGAALYVQDESSEVPITGKVFADPELPDASLSPAMTVVSFTPDSAEEFTVEAE